MRKTENYGRSEDFRILHREQGQENWERLRDMEDRLCNIPRKEEWRRDRYLKNTGREFSKLKKMGLKGAK